MAIRLFVHARDLRASVEFSSPKIIAPAFQKATTIVSHLDIEPVVGFADIQAMVAHRNLISSVFFRNINAADVILDPDTLNRYFRGDDSVTVCSLVRRNSYFY